MPAYTRYEIEVETTVKVTTSDGKTVGVFSVNNGGKADSDRHPLTEAITNVVQELVDPASKYAATLSEIENDRIRR